MRVHYSADHPRTSSSSSSTTGSACEPSPRDLAGSRLARILERNSDAVILGVRCRAARPYPGGSESRNRLSGTPTWPVLLFGAPATARAVWIGRPGTWTDQIGSPRSEERRVGKEC